LQPGGPLTWSQFLDWFARYEQQPWGEARADARGIAHTIIGLSPYSEANAKTPSGDWPYWTQEEEEAAAWDPVAAWERIKAYNEAHANGESS